MRYKAVFLTLFSLLLGTANATWKKINDVNYTWGPFNIYHITLFTETGSYAEGTRPLMLTLQYKKPWEGRDFAASLPRTWNNLGIQLPEQQVDGVITRLRKTFPDIKPEDTLHYIALEDRGYFILNDRVVSEVFNKEFSDAIAAIWLDPKMDISRQLLDPSYKPKVEEQDTEQPAEQVPTEQNSEQVNAKETKVEAPQIQIEKQTEDLTKKEIDTNEVKLNSQEIDLPKQEQDTANKKDESSPENKAEEKPRMFKIENPEVVILPIYDDFVMLQKHYA
ncbi:MULTISPECIES: cell envelope integrity protein TolA [unclassified Mannheimia]|uniref:cell envelope integrity protein TolA n=1 Tax=unclassified Mannheimia TaxID=2645054 RepID=UPI00359D05D5